MSLSRQNENTGVTQLGFIHSYQWWDLGKFFCFLCVSQLTHLKYADNYAYPQGGWSIRNNIDKWLAQGRYKIGAQ